MTSEELAAYNKNRRFFQVGIVVPDLDAALKAWTELYSVGPWTVYTHSDDFVAGLKRREDVCAAKFKFRCALTMVGDLQIELIQPVYGLPVYEKFIERTGGGIHHLKEKLSAEELPKRLDELAAKGFETVFSADFYGSLFAYADTAKALGTLIEFGNCAKASLPPDYPNRDAYPKD